MSKRTDAYLLSWKSILFILLSYLPFWDGGWIHQPETNHIVFLIGEQEYKTKDTLPAFAEQYLVPQGYRCTFVHADPDQPNEFPGIEAVLDADLVVVSIRRRTLHTDKLQLLRDYIDAGKPLLAVRTSSHAFWIRDGEPPEGHASWRQFDAEVLGATYDGHFANDLLPEIEMTSVGVNHPILHGLNAASFKSGGSLYRSLNPAPTARILLEGRIRVEGKNEIQPVAWTNNLDGQRIFYTSLGHPSDFEQPLFKDILSRSVRWLVGDDVAGGSFDPFFELNFPFITTTVDADNLGPTVPQRNITVRGPVIRVGREAYMAFDPDLLRMSVGWIGEDALSLTAMAQISYHQSHNKRNQIPKLHTVPHFATGVYPGWMRGTPRFEDPRPGDLNPNEVGRGPIDVGMGRWNGLYVVDQDVVLSYSVYGTGVYEQPGSIQSGTGTGFTRTFRVTGTDQPLTLVAAEISDAVDVSSAPDRILVGHRSAPGYVTAVGLVDAPVGAVLELIDSRYVVVKLPSGLTDSMFRVVLWKGKQGEQDAFEQMLDQPAEMVAFEAGGPSRWIGETEKNGMLAQSEGAFVLDEIPLPIPNAWKRNVRPADLDFFEDGRAAVVTYEGDVWIVSNLSNDLQQVKWKRFASGLYESMSLEIVDGDIYTFGRAQITRLHDLNGDNEADYYENFSNLAVQTIESREFPLAMVEKPGGGFYLSKGGALNNGPRTSEGIMSGFRVGGPHSGSVVEISADGRSAKTYASGFREPYLGIHPETGLLTASDQQGNFVPSTPIYVVHDGGYYGVPATAQGFNSDVIESPLTWVPHHVDRSGAGQVWALSEKLGPLNGALIHISYGEPALYRVFMDESAVQGGIFRLPLTVDIPVQKGRLHPVDGLLYLVGFQVWDSSAERISGFKRLRFTGGRSTWPNGLTAGREGIILRFGTRLDPASVTNVANYFVNRWNYRRTGQYGSGHYKLDGTSGQNAMRVASVQISDDDRGIFLVLPDMQEVEQMEVGFRFMSDEGEQINGAVYLTVNELNTLNPASMGFDEVEMNAALATGGADEVEQEQSADAERGHRLYQQYGCMACHSIDGTTVGFRGPSLKGLWGRERTFEDGTSALADADYIRTSILNPGANIVDGFEIGMASFQGILSDADLESIILFIRSLE